MFSIFLLKPPAVLRNLCQYLSIHNTVWLGWAYTKIDSQHAVKKVLVFAEK